MTNLNSLFNLLSDKAFKDPDTGSLFFPAYIYTYDPQEEYELRRQIKLMDKKLQRPNHYLECQILNIYKELIQYLKEEKFAGQSLFDQIIEKEQEDPGDADYWLREEIDVGFYEYLQEKMKNYFEPRSQKRVYLMIYGFGSIFPYLRASEFLVRNEKSIKEFKIILFYPGSFEDANYRLFGMLNDENMYRANHLNKYFPTN